VAVGGSVPLIRRLGAVPHVGGRRHQDRLTARGRRWRAADGRGGHLGRTVGVVVVRYSKTKTAVGTLVVVVAVVVARRTTTLNVAVAS